jgi:hypothetical protein
LPPRSWVTVPTAFLAAAVAVCCIDAVLVVPVDDVVPDVRAGGVADVRGEGAADGAASAVDEKTIEIVMKRAALVVRMIESILCWLV